MKLLLLVLSVFIFIPAFGQDCNKSTIYFRSAKYHSNKKYLAHLDSVLGVLHPDTTYLLEIHGHTDANGTDEENKKLAAKRIQFAVDYITDKELGNVNIICRNFGELSPVSDKNKLNRRVNIFTTPINSDGTITIYGEDNQKVNIASRAFNHCGYCLAHPELSVKAQLDNENSFAIRIESNCEKDVTCYSVEFRFPYTQFNDPAKIKVPRPIFIRGCGRDTNAFTKDSIDPAYYDKFKISFDTITDEYVVSHDCFDPRRAMCCGRGPECHDLRLHLSDSVISRRTAYYYKYREPPLNIEVFDSTIHLGDTNYFQRRACGDFDVKIYGLGYINGELLFLKMRSQDLHLIPVFNILNILAYYESHIYIEDYKPLEYLGTTLQLKIPSKLAPDSLGYYITELDYFIPIEHFKRRRYRKALLDFTFDFGIMKDNEFESFEYTDLKKRYRKRRKLLKVKIKKKHIKILNIKTIE